MMSVGKSAFGFVSLLLKLSFPAQADVTKLVVELGGKFAQTLSLQLVTASLALSAANAKIRGH